MTAEWSPWKNILHENFSLDESFFRNYFKKFSKLSLPTQTLSQFDAYYAFIVKWIDAPLEDL